MEEKFLKTWEVALLAVMAILCIVAGCLCQSFGVVIFGGMIACAAIILGVITDLAKQVGRQRTTLE